MRVSIAGAGSVGRFIARQLIDQGHRVLLIEHDSHAIARAAVPDAEWLLADACEVSSLSQARLETCDIAIAATGDDKVNLVHSLLAKTEFGVPRTVARVNDPTNEWLFDELWGVDVAVSTPRIMAALAEAAVPVGDLVRLFGFARGDTNLVGLTLPAASRQAGQEIGQIDWPDQVVVVAVIRDGCGLPPRRDLTLAADDEVLFVASPAAESALRTLLSPAATRSAREGAL